MPVLYDRTLLFLTIISPTKDEVHNCRRLKLISIDPWDTFLFNVHYSLMESLTGQIDTESLVDDVNKADPIRSKLMSTMLYEILTYIPSYTIMEWKLLRMGNIPLWLL